MTFPGHGGTGEHYECPTRARCLRCMEWCYPQMPCTCCEPSYIAPLTDQQVYDQIPQLHDLAVEIYNDVVAKTGEGQYDPRPLAVRMYRNGWRQR